MILSMRNKNLAKNKCKSAVIEQKAKTYIMHYPNAHFFFTSLLDKYLVKNLTNTCKRIIFFTWHLLCIALFFSNFSEHCFLFFFPLLFFGSFCYVFFYCMMHWSGFRPRYGSVEHENERPSSHLDNSVFEDAHSQMGHTVFEDAPRAMFDEDQEQQNQEPPPMNRSKSSLGAQSRGIQSFFLSFFFLIVDFFFLHNFHFHNFLHTLSRKKMHCSTCIYL